MTQQIFSSPKAFLAGHIGDMSKRKAAGIGQICMSKPTWFDSRSAMETGKLYNVKCGEWHAISMTPNTKVAIIENDDTGPENTDFHYFS